MNKQAPSAARILTMVAFAASCIGLLLFLWISFGGTTSLGPEGYRDQRGVRPGREPGQPGRRADLRGQRRQGGRRQPRPPHGPDPGGDGDRPAVRAAAGRHARDPAPEDAAGRDLRRALAGNPERAQAPRRRRACRSGQIAPTVQLDQILSTFDPATRQAFQTWMQQQGTALTGRGQDLNAALAELYPFATNVDSVLAVLNRDSAATSTLLRDGGQVFSSIARSPARSSSWSTTAMPRSRPPPRRRPRWRRRSGRSRPSWSRSDRPSTASSASR